MLPRAGLTAGWHGAINNAVFKSSSSKADNSTIAKPQCSGPDFGKSLAQPGSNE